MKKAVAVCVLILIATMFLPAQTKMPQYEYFVTTISRNSLESTLNLWGNAGWLLISLFLDQTGIYTAVFYRPKL
jgi:hypothetical protein